MNAATAMPVVIDSLVATARAAGAFDPRHPDLPLDEDGPLFGVSVGDGWLVTDEPGAVLMIGVEDPETPGAAFSGDSVQSWPHAGHSTSDEEGEITCCAWAWNAEDDQKAARDAVVAVTTALARVLEADPSAGLPQPGWTRFGSSLRLSQAQEGTNRYAVVLFRVSFRARLTLNPT